jgi:hypothetical protein
MKPEKEKEKSEACQEIDRKPNGEPPVVQWGTRHNVFSLLPGAE